MKGYGGTLALNFKTAFSSTKGTSRKQKERSTGNLSLQGNENHRETCDKEKGKVEERKNLRIKTSRARIQQHNL